MNDEGLLTLVQWLSPAFPVGGYAYSHGLEWAITAGDVRSEADLAAWLGAILAEGALWSDAVLLAHALRDGADLTGLAALAEAMAPSRERHAETMEQGRAFGLAIAAMGGAAMTGAAMTGAALGGMALGGTDRPAMPYPVAVGAAARRLAVPAEQVVALYLQAVLGNLVQVAVRFVPLGQSAGQRVLAGLIPATLVAARQAVPAGLDAVAGAGLRADLASMRHETLDVRIYRT